MNYLIQEIEALQRQLRGHQKAERFYLSTIDILSDELDDMDYTLATVMAQRDGARDLIKQLSETNTEQA